jgi:Protein kinase domain/Ankyrin repeats (3 copies)/Ankyrin repeat
VATSEILQELITAHPNTERQTQYQIKGILGEGGSGITYCAQIAGTEQEVALKELSLQQMTEWKALELFEREAQVLAKLRHPAIPKYIDYFAIDTPQNRSFYIVQELAPGKTLSAWLQSGWRCNEAEVKNIATQLLQILVYLQNLKPAVIHRDIKPSNILRTADGLISLVDFGAVQQTYHDTFLRGSTVVGTFGYMAPEQFRGQALPATDLYGLGATILTLLTNRSPAELAQENLKISFRSKVQVSASFADWLEQLLEPDTVDRFTSATNALANLQKPPRKKNPARFPWPQLLAVGLCSVVTVGVLDYYKYYFMSMWGFTPIEAFNAVWNGGDAKKVRSLLDRGVSPNAKDVKGSSLLHYAVTNNRLEVTKLLIERGADIHARYSADGHTVLHLSVLHTDGEMTKLLLINKADPNVRDNLTYTPLHIAILRKLTPYVSPIESYYGIRDVDNKSSSLQSMKYLLQYGADVNAMTTFSPMLKNVVDRLDSSKGRYYYGTPRDMTVDDPIRDPFLIQNGGKRARCQQQTLDCKLDS